MEYVPGETLEDYLKRQPNQRIDEHTALNLISPVLDALEYLDAQDPPIIHRDIKPTNIRRTPDKNVYLVDFGIAKSYNSSQHTTVAARAYTPGFSPIEQYMADMRTDRRSDIYALGATLYYILSGTFPEDVPNRMQGTPLTPLSEHNPSLSTELEAIIIKMLAIWPNERYQNMAELRQALGQRGLEQQYREREARKQLEQNYSGQGILELADHTFRVNNIAFNPDGNILVSASGNTVRLWRVTDGSLIRTLSGHTNDIKRVSFSPDGKILASASDDETVRLWRVADGALIHVLQENIGWCITNVVFSPDSSLLALGSNDGIVQVWQVADGTLLKIFQDIDDVGWCITSVALSPDGAFLASVVNKIIRLWRVTDGSLLYSLTGHRDNIVCVAFSPD
jgi:WD40 repeat protein